MAEHLYDSITYEEHLAPNLYYDPQQDTEAAKILPGEYYVTARDMLLVTVLGSCVCACIRDKVSGIGGMNHFMLPDSGSDQRNPLGESARYGTYAMEDTDQRVAENGCKTQ